MTLVTRYNILLVVVCRRRYLFRHRAAQEHIMAMSDAAKKQKLAEFAKKLDDKDDWTKRNNALIDMQKLITDPEEPLKLTSREIIALRVALFQQLEDLRSTIVREACGLVSKMVRVGYFINIYLIPTRIFITLFLPFIIVFVISN